MGRRSEPANPSQRCAEVWTKGEPASPMRTRKTPKNRGTAPESEFLGVLLNPHVNRGRRNVVRSAANALQDARGIPPETAG